VLSGLGRGGEERRGEERRGEERRVLGVLFAIDRAFDFYATTATTVFM
jgi:hypothetical protein